MHLLLLRAPLAVRAVARHVSDPKAGRTIAMGSPARLGGFAPSFAPSALVAGEPHSVALRAYSSDGPPGPMDGGSRTPAGLGSMPPLEIDFDIQRSNTVWLTGNVGADPDIRYLESGRPVARIPLGIYRKQDPMKPDQRGSWVDLELWNDLAEQAANYIQKGDRIAIVGWMKIDWWNEKTTGQLRKGTKISVKELYKVRKTEWNGDAGAGAGSYGSYGGAPGGGDGGMAGMSATGGDGGYMMEMSPGGAPPQPAMSRAPAGGNAESRWATFFEDPNRYWDNRFNKRNPKAPDFKQKDTGEGLWIDSRDTPAWVPEQVAAVLGLSDAPGGGGGALDYDAPQGASFGGGGGWDDGSGGEGEGQRQYIAPGGRGAGGISFDDNTIPF